MPALVLFGLGLAAAVTLPAGAEIRKIEALGAVPLDSEATRGTTPRDAALRRALHDAVWRVAMDELAGFDTTDEAAQEALADALGDEPLDFATRFRIAEDRGERPALFSDRPGVVTEYVVMVEVYVDAARVRERLRAADLVGAPTGEARRYRVRLVLEDLGSYGAYQAVRTLLDEMGVSSAIPVEMERGRAILVVDSHRSPDALIAALVRAAPPDLSLVPLGVDENGVRLQARFLGSPAAPDPGARARRAR